MSSRLLRLAAATGAVVTPLVAFHGVASAHSNTVTCTDQATSTWTITNDYPLSESFTSPQGPSGTVAAGNGSYTDVVYVGDSLQIDAVWSDGFTETRTGTGDCTPEGGTTTTTEAPTTTTDLVTTTTEQETTTSTSTSTIPVETSTTTAATTSTTVETSTSNPATSIEVPTTTIAPTSTTTTVTPSTSVTSTLPSTTVVPVATTAPTSSIVPECSDNPNTPTDDCAPICQPVTQPDGTNSCGPSLPATGADVGWLIVPAFMMLLCGAASVICGRRR